MIRYNLAAFSAALLIVVMAVGTGSIGCFGAVEHISFGALPTGSAGLVYIAEEQGFFAANQLDVEVKNYATGATTLDALLKKDVDVAWSELPVVRKAFAQEKISIVASLSRFSDEFLFARRDHGIENVHDLAGKVIGVPRNTIAEFYLSRFLILNGLRTQDVSFVNVAPERSVDSIADGNSDGVVTWMPYTEQIVAKLGNGLQVWPVQSSQMGYGIISCRNDWINAHPGTISRLLKSLVMAEEYLIYNPGPAQQIVQQQANWDESSREKFWSQNQFLVTLDQSLVTAMEDEARWMIAGKLTEAGTVPDFLRYIYIDGLKSVKPGAVSIIR